MPVSDLSGVRFAVYRFDPTHGRKGYLSTLSVQFALRDICAGEPLKPSIEKFTNLIRNLLSYDPANDNIGLNGIGLDGTQIVTVEALLDWMTTGKLRTMAGRLSFGEGPVAHTEQSELPEYELFVINLRKHWDSYISYILRPYADAETNNRPTAVERKKHILIGCTGSIATVKLPVILGELNKYSDFVAVQVALTPSAINFIPEKYMVPDISKGICLSFPNLVERVWTNEDEWIEWKKVGDPVIHIELRKWADVLLIAPLSANFMAKMVNGLVEGLLGGVVRAWDVNKKMIVAPAMNTLMWEHPLTKVHLDLLEKYYKSPEIIQPVAKRLACGDVGVGGMEEALVIVKKVIGELGIGENPGL